MVNVILMVYGVLILFDFIMPGYFGIVICVLSVKRIEPLPTLNVAVR